MYQKGLCVGIEISDSYIVAESLLGKKGIIYQGDGANVVKTSHFKSLVENRNIYIYSFNRGSSISLSNAIVSACILYNVVYIICSYIDIPHHMIKCFSLEKVVYFSFNGPSQFNVFRFNKS